MSDKTDLIWYQRGHDVLSPLRYHLHRLITDIESYNRWAARMIKLGEPQLVAVRSDYLRDAKAALAKAERRFVRPVRRA